MIRQEAKKSVGKGWHDLIDEFYNVIEQYDNIDVIQVKEKFGLLRVYTNIDDSIIRQKLIDLVTRSSITCERCGERGTQKECCHAGSWVKTLCEECFEITKKETHLPLWQIVKGE